MERGFGWFKGRNLDTDCVGIFPCSFVKVLPADFKEDDAVPNAADPVVLKCSQALVEWGELMNGWLRESNFAKAKRILRFIQTLIKARATVLNAKVGADGRRAAKRDIRLAMSRCITELGLSFTVKGAAGVYADELNTSTMELYQLYREIDTQYKPGADAAAAAAAAALAVNAASNVTVGEKKTLVQVFLKFNAFICKVDEENDSAVELLFSLYSVQKKKDITESYVVRLTNKLMVTNLEKIDLQKTIFANVDVSDTLLVCRVVRVGKLAGRQKAAARYRIPFGLATVPISSVLQEKESRFENQLPIYLVQTKSIQIMLENPKGHTPAGGGVALEIKVYDTPDLQSLKEEVKDFDLIAFTNMLEMDSSNLKPGTVRNDFYLTLERAEVQQEGKKTAKNVEISMTVRMPSGDIVPACLSNGSGEELQDEYRTTVFYHDNNPTWTELVKVNMESALFAQCHILLEARHCTTKDEKNGKLFSIGWMPLIGENGTIVDNSTKMISLFKPNIKPKDPCYYLKPETAALKYSREFVWVTPQLASTKLIQNPCLHKLLNWHKHERDLPELLKQLTFVDRLELVKAIRDLFPALFAMMEGRSDLRLPIFDALSYLLSLLVSGRFDAFAAIVDEYFDQHFVNPNSYHHILSSLSAYFKRLASQEKGISLNGIKGLQYWFKILAKSKSAETGVHPDPLQITRELEALLGQIFGMFKSKERVDLGAQVMALKALDDLFFSSIGPFFPDERLAAVLLNFLSVVEYGHANVNAEKLEVVKGLLAGSLFRTRPKLRKLCLPAVIAEVNTHLSRNPDEYARCVDILALLFSMIQTMMREDTSPTKKMPYATECTFFIPHLVTAVENGRSDSALVAFLTLFSVLPREVLLEWVASLAPQGSSKVKEHLHGLLRALIVALHSSLPRNWFALNTFQSRTIVKTVQTLRSALVARLQSFPREIPMWTTYFELLFALVLLPQLQLENLPESKRQLLLRRYGDLRVEAAMVLRKSWNELRILQAMFVPKFVANFLSLIMCKQSDIRDIGVDMYWGVLQREIKDTGGFRVVWSATIDNLDRLSSQDDAAPIDYGEFEQFLLSAIKERLDVAEGDENVAAVNDAFVTELAKLLGLIREIKSMPAGPEYEDERILATMQLMAYLRGTDRKATYIRYVQHLSDMLSESGSFLESGITLILYGQSLKFSSDVVEAAGSYPEEPEYARKERVYLQAISLFASGKQWERAIPLMRELEQRYETSLYQYDKLAAMLQKEGSFFSLIAGTQRFFANYFRVAFYGKGFKETVRSKQFIYKGLELESLTDFTARLQLVYRKADILKTTSISAEVENGEGQYLLVTAVTPSSADECGGYKRTFDAAMPPFVQKYHEANDINYFVYSKPFKGECVGSGEVLDNPQIKEFAGLWVKKFFMVTAVPFPSYRKRQPVVEMREVDISPIQNAVSDIEAKNVSLIALTAQAARDPGQLGPLSLLLNGIIDAAVNGGTRIYTQLFLSPLYATNRPQDAELCSRLRLMLVEQVEKAAEGLVVHRMSCPEQLLGLQSKMEEFFEALENQMVPFGYMLPVRKKHSGTRVSGGAGGPGGMGEDDAAPLASQPTASGGPGPQGSQSATTLPRAASPRPAVSPRSATVMAPVRTSAGTMGGGGKPPPADKTVQPLQPPAESTIKKQKSAGNLTQNAAATPSPAPAPELPKKKSFGFIERHK